MPSKLIRKQFLLSKEENRQLAQKAAKEGLSVSNLFRMRHGFTPLESGGNRPKRKRTVEKVSPKKEQ